MFKFRDLTIVDITSDQRMVIACDSSGGIGDKEGDLVKVSPQVLGELTTQVAMMELLATGATPITIVNTLGVEMDATGKEIIKGIKKAIQPLNLEDAILTGSTEENIPVCQTSMGITIIGLMDKSKWRIKKAEKNDIIVAVGLPKMGNEILEDKGKNIMSMNIFLELLKKPYIKDILPVGSKGIGYEMNVMASTSELECNVYKDIKIDIKKSGGPATCAIVAIDEKDYEDLKNTCPIPVNKLGYLS